jgi:hypothetical protein
MWLLQWQTHTTIWENWPQRLNTPGRSSSQTIYAHPLYYMLIYLLRPYIAVVLSQPNQHRISVDFWNKLKFKQYCINTRIRNDLTAMIWKDKWNVKLLKNTYCFHLRVISVMDMEMLWSNPKYKIVTDTWAMSYNSPVMLISCGSKLSQQDKYAFITDLIEKGGRGSSLTFPWGR